MIKVAERYEETFYGCNLYLEDIEEIYNIFNEINDSEVEMIVNNYKLDSFDEIKDNKFSTITKLQISLSRPFTTFSYSDNIIYLISINNSTLIIGAYEKIKSIINNRKNTPKLKINKIIDGTIGGVLALVISQLLIEIFMYRAANDSKIEGYILFLGIFTIFTFFYYKYFNKIKTNIYNTNYEKQNFFSKNKEKVLLLIIGSLITMAVQSLPKLFQAILGLFK